ncbi:reverse transcriptase/maturase family protein [Brevibacillus laterosporus]|uniref:reverse transcriptase/maturase family protein n=1 Tax=Brevibacillus laterosporus TaxID=1465 RepID=UPI003D1EC4E5
MRSNPIGTPQEGILSPLLANVYLDIFDQWVSKQWEGKETKHTYSRQSEKLRAIKTTKLHPAYLVRYADDWVLIIKSQEQALKWKERITNYLQKRPKIKLSDEKTLITHEKKPYEIPWV